MRVAVQDIRRDAAERVAAEMGAAAFPLVFDVSDMAACLRAAEEMKQRGEVLSLLWINAGVGIGGSMTKASQSSVEWAYGVNVLGAIWTAQAFVPLLRLAGGKKHLGVTASSAALISPQAPATLYAATKHGTLAVAEALAADLEPEGIATTILCPGLFNTRIWDGARARPERYGGPVRADPSVSARWDAAKTPDVMWPVIAQTINAGGGYVACITDLDTTLKHAERLKRIAAGWRQV
jgi:NAD(P)-dependent dehydrogenase (short-subunit alcohol dehydrogenase family)